jgi:hypothetical protein
LVSPVFVIAGADEVPSANDAAPDAESVVNDAAPEADSVVNAPVFGVVAPIGGIEAAMFVSVSL